MLTEISQRAKDPFLLHDSEDLLPRIIKRNTIRWRASMSPRGSKWDLIHWMITVLVISAAHHRRVFAQPSTTELQNNSYGYLANFNSSMAVVIVFLVCAFFFMGFSSVYLRRCAESRVSGGGEGAGQTGSAPAAIARARRKQQGLDPVLIETFPILVYSAVKSLRIGKSGSLIECAVCLSEFEDCETMRLLPKCGHVFHPGCIDAWLASHVTCPVCRSKLSHDQSNETAPCSELISEEESNVREGSSRDIVINVDEIQMNFPPTRLPRSHSTGHDSLVRVGKCTEKYTLKRCSSYDVVLPR